MKKFLYLFLVFCQFAFSQTSTTEIDTSLKNPEIEKLKLEILNLKSEYSNLETKLQNKEKELSSEKKTNQNLQVDNEKLETELQNKVKELFSEKKTNQNLQVDIEDLKTKLQTKVNQINDFESEIKKLSTDVENFEKRKVLLNEFYKTYSVLIISIFSLIAVIILSLLLLRLYYWRKYVNDKSIELPEVFRSDWNKLIQKIELLSTKDEILKTDNEIISLLEKFKNALSDFARKINSNADVNKEDYVEGLNLLRQELILKNDEISSLRKGYSFKLKIQFFNELIILKDKIEFILKNRDDKELADINDGVNQIINRLNIHSFHFNVGHKIVDGSDFSFDSIEAVESKLTDDKEKEFSIYETIKEGFYLEEIKDQKIIIRPAKVIIYKYLEVIEDPINVVSNEIKDE